ncbi:MAG: HD-GYP domain-containing protein [Clostridia bacterium]|nr:HD-GYP domain-containing protein [Clostridia bacterium]
MRGKPTKEVQPGEVLGRTIFRDDGTVLVTKGTTLSQTMLKRLIQEDILIVYIEDELSEGIEPTNVISDQQLLRGAVEMSKVFKEVKNSMRFTADQKDSRLRYVYDSLHIESLGQFLDEIEKDLFENRDALYQVFNMFSADMYTYKHSVDVAVLAMLIGKELGYSMKDIKMLGFGGLLHDIGKSQIPVEVLNKKDKLTEEEWQLLQKHPEMGYELIKDVISLNGHIKQMVRYHHERNDGSGYPFALMDSELTEFIKIIVVADIFNAIASSRVYREAMTPEKIMEYIHQETVYRLDYKVVNTLLKVVHVYPEGIIVQLSDGRQGIVVESRKGAPTRPLLRDIHTKELIDLSKELTLLIKFVVN